jgi:hypothetical protein
VHYLVAPTVATSVDSLAPGSLGSVSFGNSNPASALALNVADATYSLPICTGIVC